jgi:hypothetical protein
VCRILSNALDFYTTTFLKLDIFSSSYDKVGWGRYRIAVFSGTEKISVFLARSTPEDENITLYWKGYDIGKGQDN